MEIFVPLLADLTETRKMSDGEKIQGLVYDLDGQMNIVLQDLYPDKRVVITVQAESRKVTSIRFTPAAIFDNPVRRAEEVGTFFGNCFIPVEVVRRAVLMLESLQVVESSGEELYRACLRR